MSMCRAPASTVMVSVPICRIRFIFIRSSVPASATPQGAVEWLEPTARTGAGYFAGSFSTATMSSTELTSTMTLGCEIRSPNQLVTSGSAMSSPVGLRSLIRMGCRAGPSQGPFCRYPHLPDQRGPDTPSPMPPPPLRIGVAGVGHFGRFHALKVAASKRAVLAGVFDPDTERAGTVGREAGAPPLDFSDLLAASEALVIAAPAEAHHALAMEALRAGKHVLVEKPIAATLHQADELSALAAERGLVLQVGHQERFSAAFAAMEGRLGAPLYVEATRIAPFKQRGTDVSVILDLDLILSLVASEIDSVDAVGAAVASEHADMANARIRFANGAVATITASRVAMRTERRMRVFAQDGYLAVDFANRRLTVIARGRGAPVPGVAGFGIEEASWQDHDSLAAEHAAFVASVLDGAPVLVNAAAGRRALAAALMVTDGIAAARARMVVSGLIEQTENGGRGGG